VILQDRDNKYKEGPFKDKEVARETRDWIDVGTLDLSSNEPENTI